MECIFDQYYLCISMIHGLRTPNEDTNQRNLKFWADEADKICFGHTPKNLGL